MADSGKKQVPLRLSAKLYDAIAAWAEDDFRSVNGQIEYLLTECVRQRKKNGAPVPHELDVPPDLDIRQNLRIFKKIMDIIKPPYTDTLIKCRYREVFEFNDSD